MGWSDYQDREQSEVDYRHLGTRYGTTRKDRRCHLCGGTMPAGTPFSAAAWIEDGRFQHMTHCRSPERCPVRERPCRACGGTGALWRGDNPESDRDEGYAEECQRCQGSGMVPKSGDEDMAIVGKAIRQRQAADAEHERLQAMLKRDYGPYVEVPFEWQRKQTPRAVQFPTYGWVPASLIRCRKADGKLYGWDQYREGDAFLLPQWVLEGIGAA